MEVMEVDSQETPTSSAVTGPTAASAVKNDLNTPWFVHVLAQWAVEFTDQNPRDLRSNSYSLINEMMTFFFFYPVRC